MNGSGTTVTGFGTSFANRTSVGDFVIVISAGGADLTAIVNTISSDTSLAVTVAPGSVTTTVPSN